MKIFQTIQQDEHGESYLIHAMQETKSGQIKVKIHTIENQTIGPPLNFTDQEMEPLLESVKEYF